MSRIVFCWELGGGYGHYGQIIPLARSLRDAGHEIFLIFKDLSRAHQVLANEKFTVLQAPVWLPSPVGLPTPANYADILLHSGYLEADYLRGLLDAWRSLFLLLSPNLIIFNHSPTALLAARGLTINRITLDQGFGLPPRLHPLPPMRWWQKSQASSNTEQRALSSINQALISLKLPTLTSLVDLFETEESFLCAFPELDHYPFRDPNTSYWGTISDLGTGVSARWPIGKSPQVFVYINPSYLGFSELIAALQKSPCRTLLHVPGLSATQISKYESATLIFSSQPVNMSQVCKEADLVICHSPGTGTSALLAGKPVLLLPTQMEQTMFSMRVEQLGAGVRVGAEEKKPLYKKHINALLTNNTFLLAAQCFAERYKDFDEAEQLKKMTARCQELLNYP